MSTATLTLVPTWRPRSLHRDSARGWILKHGPDVVAVVLLLAVAGIAHGWNMLGYPFYENDEATYVSRGWAFVTQGSLDVYTYRYDNAPAGWMLIGLWLAVSHGTGLVPDMLVAGRILMLIVQLVCVVCVYVLAKRFSGGSIAGGVIAAALFAISPLGIYFHRRVLLDNVMAMWMLLSALVATRRRLTLGAAIGSGMLLGLAVVTKLNAAVFAPGILLLILMRARRPIRAHAAIHWIAWFAGTAGLFPLYALLKNEFFPAPIGPNGLPTHVSLIDTMTLQAGRGNAAWPWEADSQFRVALDSWLRQDPVLILGGAAALAVLLVLAVVLRSRRAGAGCAAVVVMALGYLAFLARGKLVLNLYVTPLIPLLAIAIGLVAALLLQRIPWRPARIVLAGAVACSAIAGIAVVDPNPQFSTDETTNQGRAIRWVEQNVPASARVVTDNYAYPALALQHDFTRTWYFFNAEYDPSIRRDLAGDWRNIQYIVLTHEVLLQMRLGTVPELRQAFEHSRLVASFMTGTSSFIDLPHLISTNGDWAQVYRVESRAAIVQQDVWSNFRSSFVESYGRVVDSDLGGNTSSADQATGMEQALVANDRSTFLGIWQWTRDHLQHRLNDTLVSRLWVGSSASGRLGSSDSDCGSDLRLIHALDSAAARWSRADLAAESAAMTKDWWAACTFTAGGSVYIDSSVDGSRDARLVNPSYLMPSVLSAVAAAHPGYAWSTLAADGYALLDRLLAERGTVPDWVVVDRTGRFASAVPVIGPGADAFGPDSLALSMQTAIASAQGDARATALLARLQPLVATSSAAAGNVAAETTMALISEVTGAADAQSRYGSAVAADYRSGRWGDGRSLSDQTWRMRYLNAQPDIPVANRVTQR